MKHRKNFYLEDAAISYVRQVQKGNHLPSFTAALSQIIREHQHRNDIPPAEFFAKEMAKQIAEELKTPLTRIRLGVNNADRNSDILLLLINILFVLWRSSRQNVFNVEVTKRLKIVAEHFRQQNYYICQNLSDTARQYYGSIYKYSLL